jgi:DNA (cytosine-5)-methyltransferase 1
LGKIGHSFLLLVRRRNDRVKLAMRYLSLFSGLGGAELAFAPLGWESVGVSEIDPAACAVLAHYHPNTPNLGDIKAVTEEQIKALGKIDLVVFGFPCQDLSVAGKRAGLKDEDGENTRSGLFFDAMRIVRWSGARWAVAENVPGLFSSEQGRDFAAVVGEMAGVRVDVPDGGWENSGFLASGEGLIEWAVLDAQFFGVPQRRRRVFLIRDTGDWQSREPILLIQHSLSGHPPPRKEKGQRVAGCLKGGSGERGWSDPSDGNGGGMVEVGGTSGRGDGGIDGSGEPIPKWPAEIASTLDAHFGDKWELEDQHINSGASHFVPVAYRTNAAGQVSSQGDGDGALTSNTDPCSQILAFRGGNSAKARSMGITEDCSPTLPSSNSGSNLAPVIAFTQNSRDEVRVLGEDGEVAGSLSEKPGTHQTTYITMVEQNTQASTPELPSFGGNKTPNYAVAYDQYNGGSSDKAFSVTSGTGTASHNIVSSVPVVMTLGHTTGNGLGITETETANTLKGVSSGNQAVAWHIQDQNTGKSIKAKSSDISTCLGTRDLSKYQGTFNADVIQSVMQVRRLTPVECSRLQGVPDSHLDIIYKGKPLADGLKYKMLGNGFAVPVVGWIGTRIQIVEELTNGIS